MAEGDRGGVLLASPRPPANADEIAEAVVEAQAEIAAVVAEPPFNTDPFRLVLAALSVTLGVFPRIVRRIETAVADTETELAALVRTVRHPLTDAERAALARDTIQAAREGATAGAKAAAAELAALARAQDRRFLAIAVTVVATLFATSGTALFFAGRQSLRAKTTAMIAAQKVEVALAQERINLTSAQAAAWLRLIRANGDLSDSLLRTHAVTDPTGRRYGAVPLWLDPAGAPPSKR